MTALLASQMTSSLAGCKVRSIPSCSNIAQACTLECKQYKQFSWGFLNISYTESSDRGPSSGKKPF